MKTKILMTALIAGCSLAWSPDLSAHGGVYRGPKDFVPPHNGTGSGKSGQSGKPGTPTTPGAPTPRTPKGPTPMSPNGPTPNTGNGTPPGDPGRNGPATTGGTSAFEIDMTSWTFWWEFNKDPFLNLRERMQGRQAITAGGDFTLGRGPKRDDASGISPTSADRDRVMQTLMKILEAKPDNRDLVSSALIAVAKIGGKLDYLPLLKSYLITNSQEIQETAALALGISARLEAAPLLFALARNDEEGRTLVGGASVSYRTRAFACYGLGLIAHDARNLTLKRKVFAQMKGLLDSGRATRNDIQVAALHALRLLDPEDGAQGRALRTELADYLLAFSIGQDKEHSHRVRSHGVSALARIVGKRDLPGDHKHALFQAFAKRKRIRNFLDQSVVQAMGWMCSPDDTEINKWVMTRQEKSRDQDARHFAMIALGRIGGEANRAYLLKKMAKTSKRPDKAWYALAIALLHHQEDRKHSASDLTLRSDAAALHDMFKKEGNRSVAAGIAVALGMMDYRAASLDILDRLENIQNDDQPAGYMALSLGMMGESEARDLLQHLIDKSKRRDQLLMQVSIGLGLLGDNELTTRLVKLLQAKHTTVAVYGSVATALGFLNDRKTIDPLLALVSRDDQQGLSRAFAAVSLGLIGEKERLPWNSKIASGSNYVANFETLTGGSLGVLDIL